MSSVIAWAASVQVQPAAAAAAAASVKPQPAKRKASAPVDGTKKKKKKVVKPAPIGVVPECCKNSNPVRYCCMSQDNCDHCQGIGRASMVAYDMRLQLEKGFRMTKHLDGFKIARAEYGITSRSKTGAYIAFLELYPELTEA